MLQINEWDQEQLRLIWIDVSTLVSLVREPGVSLFYITEPTRTPSQPARQVSPIATARATQVFYSVVELRRLRALAGEISPTQDSGTGERHPQARRDAARRHRDARSAGKKWTGE